MDDSVSSADLAPIVVAVKENALAVSIELTVQAMDLSSILHDPARGLGDLPLKERSTLIVDEELLPRGAKAFFARLRAGQWRGLAIVLAEDAPGAARLAGAMEDVLVIEKPFLNAELVSCLRIAHPDGAPAARR